MSVAIALLVVDCFHVWRRHARWADAAGRHDKVVVFRHAPRRLDNLALVIGNDLDALERNAEREAELGKVRRVCVDRLENSNVVSACVR